MTLNQLIECERRRLEKFSKFRLPNRYKQIGIVLLCISVIALITSRVISLEVPILKLLIKNIMLASMMIIAISREKIEDELVVKLKAQAYQLAFISGVIYALIQPFINYLVTLFIRPEKAIYSDLDMFHILLFMLGLYLMFFHFLKRLS